MKWSISLWLVRLVNSFGTFGESGHDLALSRTELYRSGEEEEFDEREEEDELDSRLLWCFFDFLT